jgi:hypothetical protein
MTQGITASAERFAYLSHVSREDMLKDHPNASTAMKVALYVQHFAVEAFKYVANLGIMIANAAHSWVYGKPIVTLPVETPVVGTLPEEKPAAPVVEEKPVVAPTVVELPATPPAPVVEEKPVVASPVVELPVTPPSPVVVDQTPDVDIDIEIAQFTVDTPDEDEGPVVQVSAEAPSRLPRWLSVGNVVMASTALTAIGLSAWYYAKNGLNLDPAKTQFNDLYATASQYTGSAYNATKDYAHRFLVYTHFMSA